MWTAGMWKVQGQSHRSLLYSSSISISNRPVRSRQHVLFSGRYWSRAYISNLILHTQPAPLICIWYGKYAPCRTEVFVMCIWVFFFSCFVFFFILQVSDVVIICWSGVEVRGRKWRVEGGGWGGGGDKVHPFSCCVFMCACVCVCVQCIVCRDDESLPRSEWHGASFPVGSGVCVRSLQRRLKRQKCCCCVLTPISQSTYRASGFLARDDLRAPTHTLTACISLYQPLSLSINMFFHQWFSSC